MYYITKGLRMKWLGVFFSVALIVELIPSIMVQGNSVSVSLAETFSFNKIYAGIGIAFLIGLVVIGGVKRIGKVTEFVVPLMAGAYAGAGLLIVLMNLSSVPAFFSLVFQMRLPLLQQLEGSQVLRWRKPFAGDLPAGCILMKPGWEQPRLHMRQQ